jgi:hypothetical protein
MCWSGRAAHVETRSAVTGRRCLCPSSTRQGPRHEVRSEAGVAGSRYADAAAQSLRRQLPLAALPGYQPNRAPVKAAGALPAQQPSGQQAPTSQARQFRWAGQRAVKPQARQFRWAGQRAVKAPARRFRLAGQRALKAPARRFRLGAQVALAHWFRQTAVMQVALAHRSPQRAPAAARWPDRPKRE